MPVSGHELYHIQNFRELDLSHLRGRNSSPEGHMESSRPTLFRSYQRKSSGTTVAEREEPIAPPPFSYGVIFSNM